METVSPSSAKEVMNIKETCRYLGVSEPSLLKLTRQGVIPRRRFAALERARFYFIKSEVDKALQDQHEN